MPDHSSQTSRAAIPLEGMPYTTRPLDASTWDAFAELVERNNGIYGGCWCIAHPPSPPAAEPLWAPNNLGYRHICLDVPNIEELYEQLSPNWTFLSKPVAVPAFNVTTVYLIGPGNVLIQLTQKNTSGAADG